MTKNKIKQKTPQSLHMLSMNTIVFSESCQSVAGWVSIAGNTESCVLTPRWCSLSLANFSRSIKALGSHNFMWNVLKSSCKWHIYTINASARGHYIKFYWSGLNVPLAVFKEDSLWQIPSELCPKRRKEFLLNRHREWCSKAKRRAFC